jgi:HSP20 family protein
MNRLFEDTFERSEGSARATAPLADFAETDHEYEISLDLPGLQPDEVDVEFHDGQLTISGVRKPSAKEDGKTFHRVERTHREFRRVIALGNEVDADNIKARYEQGVLTVIAPKVAAIQPKKIAVTT